MEHNSQAIYFFFFLLWENIHNIKFAILTIFKCEVGGIKYVHSVVQLALPYIYSQVIYFTCYQNKHYRVFLLETSFS